MSEATSKHEARDEGSPSLGLSGNLTRAFIGSALTPLFLLAALALGLVALVALPREEEPQISVPMVDIMLKADGLKAEDAVRLVTEPLETIVKAINGVEHVYSNTLDDRVLVTARFLVGTKSDEAILRVHEKIRANMDRIPIGIPEPLIVGRGIDDVAIVTLTLAPKGEAADRWQDNALYHMAENLQIELAKLEDVGLTYIAGGRPDQIRVEPDPEKLSLFGVTLQQLVAKVQQANRSFLAGRVRENNRSVAIAAGQTLSGIPDIGLLLIGARDGRPVYVRDVATVIVGAKPLERHAWHFRKSATGSLERVPAVTLAIAKRAGANAVVISERILERIAELQGKLVPNDVEVVVTRNYGETANEKANELLYHLGLATVSIVLLVGFAIGWREAVVVAIVIPVTILLTLFASWIMGYTINRVSLFALIFSIGILVDDAIVVIENIARHWGMSDGRSRTRAAIEAVAEVGNPTIVATLTVVAALLPMLFVSGLMGPYMSPIPANASSAMILSFFVAVVVTPWLMMRLGGGHAAHSGEAAHGGRLGQIYAAVARPVLATRRRVWWFLLLVAGATVVSLSLIAFKLVTVKLLPFDNKSELQVVVDLPRGTSLEETDRVLHQAASRLAELSELASIQAYAGTAAPFNFNGLVRHYYLRSDAEQGDLQVNLRPKSARSRSSHEIALDVRKRLAGLALPERSSIKVVEVPPGPPVISTLLAEIYGPDAETRRAVPPRCARSSSRALHRRRRRQLRRPGAAPADRDQPGQSRVLQGRRARRLRYRAGLPLGHSRRLFASGRRTASGRDCRTTSEKQSRHVRTDALHASSRQRTPWRARHRRARRCRQRQGGKSIVPDLPAQWSRRRDGDGRAGRRLRGADLRHAGGGRQAIAARDWGTLAKPQIAFHGQPRDESKPVLLWDGEWEVTYVTFRDMGAAFMVALLGIYILVVAQFGSFKLPLVILTPVPLTLIGIMLGHWLFGAPFTATSMIGFIALAGIIVRNSILLVDFIRHTDRTDKSLRDVLVEAGAVRFKPILLTAVAAMIGAAVILFDPIFQGLAISLLFGLASSTLLTVLVIPAIYVVLRDDGKPFSTLEQTDSA